MKSFIPGKRRVQRTKKCLLGGGAEGFGRAFNSYTIKNAGRGHTTVGKMRPGDGGQIC